MDSIMVELLAGLIVVGVAVATTTEGGNLQRHTVIAFVYGVILIILALLHVALVR